MGKETSSSQQSSGPISPRRVAGYFRELDKLTGGRLDDFARGGTPTADFNPLNPEQIRALGGLGATRTNQVQDARRQALEEINADASLTLPQRMRARQLTDTDAQNRLDAILKESEGAITQTAERQGLNAFEAAMANNLLTRGDMEALARMFYGGMAQQGQTSSSSREGLSDFFSFGINI